MSEDSIPDGPGERLGPLQLFLLFSQLSLLGFGGVLPMAYRFLVERRKMLTIKDFGDLLGFAQLLPGATICNLAVIMGYRNAGIAGGAAALAGMVGAPMAIVIMLGIAYQSSQQFLLVQQALAGMSSVAAGLIVVIPLRLIGELRKNWIDLLFAAIAFIAVGLLRLPLLLVLATLLPLVILVHVRIVNGKH